MKETGVSKGSVLYLVAKFKACPIAYAPTPAKTTGTPMKIRYLEMCKVEILSYRKDGCHVTGPLQISARSFINFQWPPSSLSRGMLC